jgi:hypothetical protein
MSRISNIERGFAPKVFYNETQLLLSPILAYMYEIILRNTTDGSFITPIEIEHLLGEQINTKTRGSSTIRMDVNRLKYSVSGYPDRLVEFNKTLGIRIIKPENHRIKKLTIVDGDYFFETTDYSGLPEIRTKRDPA